MIGRNKLDKRLEARNTIESLSNNETSDPVISKEIHNIIESQKYTFSIINISYYTLVIIFLLIRITIESLLVYSPIYLYSSFNFNAHETCIFLTITALLIIPSSILINKLLLLIEERKMIIGILVILFLSFLAFSFIILEYSIIFFILYSFALIMTNILETYVTFLYSQIISSKISGYSGFIIILCTTGGKVLGSLLVSFFALYQTKYYDLEWKLYACLFFLVCGITIKNLNTLKVSSISRIMKKQEYFNF